MGIFSEDIGIFKIYLNLYLVIPNIPSSEDTDILSEDTGILSEDMGIISEYMGIKCKKIQGYIS